MKLLVTALSLGLLFAPGLVMAENSAGPPAPSAAMDQSMEQAHAQMMQLQAQTRTAILGSLTAAHRAALANIVGGLAVAPQPNRGAAARQLDSLLSPAEGQAILRAYAAYQAQIIVVGDRLRSQFENQLPDQRVVAVSGNVRYLSGDESENSDPGRILLRVTLGDNMPLGGG